MDRVGLQIGDLSYIWTVGADTTAVPAKVGTLERVQTAGIDVVYLLAGDEAGPDVEPLHPRRIGLDWGTESVTFSVLQSILARCRQDFPPGGKPHLVVAVPYWCQRVGTMLERAALASGWGSCSTLTDLYALLGGAHTLSQGITRFITMVPGLDTVDAGLWTKGRGGWEALAWETWSQDDMPQRLARLASVADGSVTVVSGGDAGDLWADALEKATHAAGATWHNLGPGAVSQAASLWDGHPVIPTADRFHFALEIEGRYLALSQPADHKTVFRALETNGTLTVFRIVGGWGHELAPSVVLWQTVAQSRHQPVVLRLQWGTGMSARIALVGGAEELATGEFTLRTC